MVHLVICVSYHGFIVKSNIVRQVGLRYLVMVSPKTSIKLRFTEGVVLDIWLNLMGLLTRFINMVWR